MKKLIAILRSTPACTVDVPATFPKKKGDENEPREIERSCFGALRFFPGIPKAISVDEMEYVRLERADLYPRFDVRPYVESKRVDRRGATEDEIEKLAKSEGIEHLDFANALKRLRQRGKIGKAALAKPKVSSKKNKPKKDDRKPTP